MGTTDVHVGERLSALVGCIHGLVLEFDGEARYLNAWADDPALLARPAPELVGRTIEEVLGEAGAPFTAAVRRVHATGTVESFEYSLDLPSGRHWFIADMKRVGAGESGVSVVFFARDITQRKATEEALARSEERYRLAARATNDALWDWDVADDLGKHIDWLKNGLHPDDAKRVQQSLEEALKGNAASWSARYRFRRADGIDAEILDRGLIVRDEHGVATRMVGSMADVTEMHRLQQRLAQSDRLAALGLMAAGIGHEINNPLTYAIGNLELALEQLAGSESDMASLIKDAYDGALQIADIVRSLKALSRAECAVTAPLDIHVVLERAIRMAENEIRHRGRLIRRFGDVPRAIGTEAEVTQVFLNLLVNAAQALDDQDRDRSEIIVTTGVDARGRPLVTIADTGRGIPSEHLDRIFDPFFTTKKVGDGTGLGLSICHDIVQKLGGEIAVETVLGQGTTFSVALQGAPEPKAAAEPQRRRLLVVDDEVAIGRFVKRLLEKDLDVVVATSGKDALANLVDGQKFDLILCDVMMPGMTGMDLFEALRTKRPDMLSSIVFMTGGAFTTRAREFLEAEKVRCIDKPLDRVVLRSLLKP